MFLKQVAMCLRSRDIDNQSRMPVFFSNGGSTPNAPLDGVTCSDQNQAPILYHYTVSRQTKCGHVNPTGQLYLPKEAFSFKTS